MTVEIHLSNESLPPGKSRCPRCKALHDVDSSRIAKLPVTDPAKAAFEAYLATELQAEQIHLKCPSCGATYETQAPAPQQPAGTVPGQSGLAGTKAAIPVSKVCPKCGSADHTKVKPEAVVAFAKDRICRQCSTRYTPPTPMWARPIFGILGLAAVIGAPFFVMSASKSGGIFGLFVGGTILVLGICLIYKAFSK